MKKIFIIFCLLACMCFAQAEPSARYAPQNIEFLSLTNGDFLISITVSGRGPFGIYTVEAKASELQDLTFIQVVELFRSRINAAFGVQP